eukprot:3297719-Pleurochrysis_carterae.AAC.1
MEAARVCSSDTYPPWRNQQRERWSNRRWAKEGQVGGHEAEKESSREQLNRRARSENEGEGEKKRRRPVARRP